MPPCKLKFLEIISDREVVRGDSMNFPLEFIDPDTKLPISIVGSTIYLTIRRKNTLISKDDTDAVFQKIETTHIDPENGTSQIGLTPVDWNSINIADDEWIDFEYVEYKYDISIAMASGVGVTVLLGNLLIQNDITKS